MRLTLDKVSNAFKFRMRAQLIQLRIDFRTYQIHPTHDARNKIVPISEL